MEEDPLKSPISLGAALTPEEEAALLWGMAVKRQERPINMDVFAQRLFPIPTPQPVPPAPIPSAPQKTSLIQLVVKWLKDRFGGRRTGV